MSKELVIGSNRHETKVAMLEDDQLVEIYFQRAQEYSLAGSIHKGRVTRVLPGMQSAFVDVGLERDTFLYVSDFFEENEDFDTLGDEKSSPKPQIERVQSEPGQERRSEARSDERPSQRYSDRKASPAAESAAEPVSLASPELTQSANAGTTGLAEPREQSGRERPDDDRDGRGRRSRRRRTRGRGFPENKYAQPGSGNETPASTVDAETEIERPEPFFNRGVAAADVVVLPGESLAKYKRQPQTAETRANDQTEESVSETSEAREIDPATIPDSVNVPSSAMDEVESSVEEHDELQPDTSKGMHSEDIAGEWPADVKASSVESISIFEDDADVAATSKPGLDLLTPSIVEEAQVEASELPLPSVGPSEAEVAAIQEAAEAAIRNKFTDIQESPSLDDIASPEAEDSDALLAAGTSETEPGDEVLSANDPDAETTPSQSASVREQGGRFLQHRSGRRMRRRRGGNRFGQNAPAEGGAGPQAAPAVAPAVEPEPRIEQREQREPRDQREHREPRATAATDQRSERVLPSITDLLKPGQEIIVQIAKEPLGQKGARITSHVALPGRYVVFMPSVEHLGVSRKIASDEERQRLKRILQKHRVGTTGGFIVRTAGEGHSEEEIGADMSFLYNLWLDIRQKAEKKPAPLLLHHDLDVVQRILRDHVTEEYKSIWVDSEEMYESILRFVQRFQPALVSRVKMYTRSAPVFDAFNITQELEKALHPKVWLKSGGYIVINQTEALVAIDINTGKYVGKSNRLEDTIVKTNIEAVKEIVRQIRLRDLGGIIVVDFIDMDERKNRQKVMQALEEAMRSDKAPNKILQFNDFGLVAITRKRVKQSLERTLCSPCPYCEGAGYVKSVQTIISEILVEAQKLSKAIEGKDVVLRVHPDVAKVLKANTNQYLEEIESILGRPVLVSKDNSLHHEKFDLA